MAVYWNYENTANNTKSEEKGEVDHNPWQSKIVC